MKRDFRRFDLFVDKEREFMDVQKDWTLIKSLFRDGVKSSGFFAIASSNPDGSPHVSPIGSLILYEPGHGVYADEFPAILSRNIAHNPRVCVMSVNSGKGFWLGLQMDYDLYVHRVYPMFSENCNNNRTKQYRNTPQNSFNRDVFNIF